MKQNKIDKLQQIHTKPDEDSIEMSKKPNFGKDDPLKIIERQKIRETVYKR